MTTLIKPMPGTLNRALFCIISILLLAIHLSAQCNLPLHFGFDNPPEFDPATMEAIPTLTGQNGLLDIVNGAGAEGSAYCARFSKSVDDNVLTQNALNLKMNLSGCAGKQLELSFYMNDDNDETQYYDGVFLSDGGTFKRVFGMEPGRWCNGIWGFVRLDLDELITRAGLNYTADFKVQFRHEGKQFYNGFYSDQRDNFYLDEVRINEAPAIIPATLPFKEGFASGLANDPAWYIQPMQLDASGVLTNTSSPYEWTEKVNSNASDGDGYSLFMGKWKGCNGEMQRNSADLHLNLSGLENSDLELSFDFMNYFDETQPEDGIWLSSDGGKTFPDKHAISLEPATWAANKYGSFHHFDLDELIRKQGLTFSADFVIRFQHQDDQSNESGFQSWQLDGLFYDNIQVRMAPPVVYKQVPFCDNLDQAGINLDHWRPVPAAVDQDGTLLPGETSSQVCGLYQLLGNGPKSWHLGKNNDDNGVNINFLDLHVRAANLSPVTMSFDLYEFWEEYQTEDGIYLSVDAGAHFSKIYDFDWEANPDGQWKPFQINLVALAAAQGFTLSDQTVIRFGQQGTSDWSGFYADQKDGYAIKNICLSGTVADQEPIGTKDEFSLYPNPTTSGFNINMGTNSQSTVGVSIFDLTGRLVEEQHWDYLPPTQQTLKVDFNCKMISGAYWIRIQNGTHSELHKLLVD